MKKGIFCCYCLQIVSRFIMSTFFIKSLSLEKLILILCFLAISFLNEETFIFITNSFIVLFIVFLFSILTGTFYKLIIFLFKSRKRMQ